MGNFIQIILNFFIVNISMLFQDNLARSISAYQDYINRAKVSELILAGADAKINVSEYAQVNGTLSGAGTNLSVNTAGKNISTVAGSTVTANGTITVVGSGITGGVTLSLAPTLDSSSGVITWSCTGTPAKLMPASCK